MQNISKSRRGVATTLVILALVAILLGVWLQADSRYRSHLLQHGTLLVPAKGLNNFLLTDDKNRSFTNKNLQGQWSLMFFGFTHCPMVCPTTLAELNDAYRMIKSKEPDLSLKVIFVSVDPKRDTPARIRSYLDSFNQAFMGVTGSEPQLGQLTKEVGVVYLKAIKSGEKNYDIDHSGMILVFNPQGQWTALLSQPLTSQDIVNDFMKIQKY